MWIFLRLKFRSENGEKFQFDVFGLSMFSFFPFLDYFNSLVTWIFIPLRFFVLEMKFSEDRCPLLKYYLNVGLDNFSFSRLAENYDIGIITKISILKVEDSLTRWYSNVIFRSVKWHKNRTGMDACGSIRVGAARFLKTMHFEYIIAHWEHPV